jgi:hypothetical protein
MIAPYILRRADFVLREAKLKDARRDQAITYALRVISNYVTIGGDGGSSKIKLLNPRISKSAHKELERLLSKNTPNDALKI